MRIWVRVVLFVGAVVSHVALTLMSVSRIIECGVAEMCMSTLDRAWNQALGFPVFTFIEVFEWLSPGTHSSGTALGILLPVNSLMFVTIGYFLLRRLIIQFGNPSSNRKKGSETLSDVD
jgi:hypothetical protein